MIQVPSLRSLSATRVHFSLANIEAESSVLVTLFILGRSIGAVVMALH
jgi:hypothetical protein